MTRRLIHAIAVALLASAAAAVGLWYFELTAADVGLRIWVVAASVVIWLTLGTYVYLHPRRAWTFAVCFGLLSPILGCALVAPPWSFALVFYEPVFCVALGLGTSLAVCGISRLLARAELSGRGHE